MRERRTQSREPTLNAYTRAGREGETGGGRKVEGEGVTQCMRSREIEEWEGELLTRRTEAQRAEGRGGSGLWRSWQAGATKGHLVRVTLQLATNNSAHATS
jgi:hypothetical protein